MPNINETLIAFTPYLCTESTFSSASKTNGDFFYCYDSGNAYTIVDGSAKPLRACQSEKITISSTQTEVTKTFAQNLNNFLVIVTLENKT